MGNSKLEGKGKALKGTFPQLPGKKAKEGGSGDRQQEAGAPPCSGAVAEGGGALPSQKPEQHSTKRKSQGEGTGEDGEEGGGWPRRRCTWEGKGGAWAPPRQTSEPCCPHFKLAAASELNSQNGLQG